MIRQKVWTLNISVCLCFLLLLLTACSQDAASPRATATTSTSSPTATAVLSPTPVPQVQTDCPQAATARVAIMPPMTPAATRPNILYRYSFSDSQQTTEIIRRYDTTNGQQADILKLTAAAADQLTLGDARISPDGQWVLFWISKANTAMLQLVRIDGQEQQTLTCVQGDYQNILWSPDQKYVLFTQPEQVQYTHTYDLYTLQLASGKLQDILQPSPIPTGMQAIINVDAPLKWVGTTSLLIEHVATGGMSPVQNYSFGLIKDITIATMQQDTAIEQVAVPHTSITSHWGDSCGDIDISTDGTHILYSACLSSSGTSSGIGVNDTATIFLQPLQGGDAQTIYTDKTHLISNTRFISPTSVLFVTENKDYTDPQVWKINVDGTGLTRLYDAQAGFGWPGYPIQYNSYQYIDTTADGSLFAYYFRINHSKNIVAVYGATDGSGATMFAQITQIVSNKISTITLIGWAML